MLERALPAVLAICCASIVRADLWQSFERCRDDQSFGVDAWLCDGDGLLSKATTANVQTLLWRLQTETECPCTESYCFRYTVNDHLQTAFGVALLVVSSVDEETDLSEAMQRVYSNGSFSNGRCDNGIVVVYAANDSRVFVQRGDETLARLTLGEEHDITVATDALLGAGEQDRALDHLLRAYLDQLSAHRNTDLVIVAVSMGALACLALLVAIVGVVCALCCAPSSSAVRDRTAGSPLYVTQEGAPPTPSPDKFMDPWRQTEVQTVDELIY